MPAPGGNSLNAVIGLHRPFDEAEALGIALVLQFHVAGERVGRAVIIDRERMIEHHVDRHPRLDGAGRQAELP